MHYSLNRFFNLAACVLCLPMLVAQSGWPTSTPALSHPKWVPAVGPFADSGFVYPTENENCDVIGGYRAAIGDLNLDGIPDVAATQRNGGLSDGCVTVHLGGPFGTLRRVAAVPVSYPIAAAIGDVDEDGAPDLVVTTSAPSVLVLTGDGSGQLAPSTVVPMDAAYGGLRLDDLNGDGHLDIVAAGALQGALPVLLGDGAGSFVAEASVPAGALPYDVVLLRLPGDNVLDLAIADYDTGSVSVFSGNGDGTFLPSQTLAVGTNAGALASGDLDGDGITDLLVNADASIEIYLGSESGFIPGPGVNGVTPFIATPPNLVDLDQDGILDLVAASITGLVTSRGVGDATFDVAAPVPHQADSTSPADSIGDIDIVDMNGDDCEDIVVWRASGSITVLLGDCVDGVVTGSTFDLGGLTSSGPRAVATGGHGVARPLIEDFDGDGIEDLVVLHRGYGFLREGLPHLYDNNFVSVQLGSPGGGIQSPTLFATGPSPSDCLAEDLDLDGDLDLVLWLNESFPSAVSIKSFLNDGAGAFAPGAALSLQESFIYGFDVFDVGVDGIPDVVVVTDNGALRTWIGNGDGTFGPVSVDSPLANVGETHTLGTFDVDGDDVTDLYAGAPGIGAVAYCLGDGLGGFAPAVATNGLSTSVQDLRDLNGDGLLDAISYATRVSGQCETEGSRCEIEISLALSPTSFGAPVISRLPLSASATAISGGPWMPVGDGDVDGDGVTDLAFLGRAGAQVVLIVARGDGTGAFRALRGNLALGADEGVPFLSAGRMQFLGDLNGDGKLDLACPWNSVKRNLSPDLNGDGYCDWNGDPLPSSLCSQDLDGDGMLDHVPKTYPSRVTIFYNVL